MMLRAALLGREVPALGHPLDIPIPEFIEFVDAACDLRIAEAPTDSKNLLIKSSRRRRRYGRQQSED